MKKSNVISSLLAIITAYVLISCLSPNGQLISEIEQLTQKTIVVPYSRLLKFKGHSQIPSNHIAYPYTIISYVDSIQCTSCALQDMVHWIPLIDSLSKYKDLVNLVLIYAPQQEILEQFKQKILRDKFPFPVYIDTCSAFISVNQQIPDNTLLHTFLINEKDSVILVGNPILNYKVKELLFEFLDSVKQ